MMLASTEEGTITGSVFCCRAPIALPRGAVVRLRLEDASGDDPVLDLIADAELPAEGRQTPIPFELPYAASRIDASHCYNVRAAILVGDDLLFTSACSHPVITGGAPSRVDIDVLPVSHALPPPAHAVPLRDTRWQAIEVRGAPVTVFDDVALEIALHAEDARLTGCGGCNRIVGFYALDGDRLRLEMAATTMSCPEACMTQERAFIEALGGATGYRVNGDRMDLLAEGRTLVSFEAVSPR